MRNLVWFFLILSSFAHADQYSDFLGAREAYRSGHIALLPVYAQRLQNSILLPYVQYWQLSSELSVTSPADIRAFIAQHADMPLSNRLRLAWLRQLGQQQDWSTFLAEYPLAVKPDIGLQCYDLHARITQEQDAEAAYREAKILWFTGKPLPSACDELFNLLVAGKYLDAEDVWQRVRLALDSNNIPNALTIMAYLPDSRLDRHQLNLAASAPAAFLARNRPPATRAEQELTLFAVYRLAQHDAAAAAAQWEHSQKLFRKTERQRIWGQIAVFASRQHLPQALAWFDRANTAMLDDDALGWKVRAALLQGDWLTVQHSILAMDADAQSNAAWQYWLARADKALGEIYKANLLLLPLSREYNFYGLLAQEELGPVITNPTADISVSPDEIEAVADMSGIRRALMLYQMDLRGEAYSEWYWTIRNFSDRQLLAAAEVARHQNWLDCAINTADRTQQLHNFSLRFLAPYRETAHIYAQEYGLDEAWVYGLMRQESRFVSRAHSGVGASGIMQVMPATAYWIANRLGLHHFHPIQLTKLDTNMQFGMYYLKSVQQNLDNSALLATAAYNAGPRRALRWRINKPEEGAIYAETIPFSETRDYVKKVFANTIFYARSFKQPDTSIKARLGNVTPVAAPLCIGGDERAPSCDSPH
ncbi:MAG TPA: transglycosylase SLT domain-containing protein [Burkholderiales bacterium]|nr:transglycosylase SLT domain-containing protein [Burkholderiales bacterium]